MAVSVDVLASAEYVSARSRHVTVCTANMRSAALRVAEGMQTERYSTATWKTHPLHPQVADDAALAWIFTVDLLNFSFWPDEGEAELQIAYKGGAFSGYWALCSGINRALDEGIPFTTPSHWLGMSRADVAHVFRGIEPNSTASLVDERLELLQFAGRVLTTKYGGSFANCLAAAGGRAELLLSLLLSDFGPCFADSNVYAGRDVPILKRAQILVADVWACFEGRGAGAFSDIDVITMFADNRVPQSLLFVGALSYTDELMGRLKRGEHLAQGSDEEIEIRCCSIWAVELLRRELEIVLGERGVEQKPNAILVDMYLWDYAKRNAEQLADIPTHKTRCIRY